MNFKPPSKREKFIAGKTDKLVKIIEGVHWHFANPSKLNLYKTIKFQSSMTAIQYGIFVKEIR
jgi:hypothetical protein